MTMTNRQRTVLGLLALMLCTGVGAAEEPRTGGTLLIGVESTVGVLDPHRAGGWSTYRVNRQIYESLVEEDLSVTADVPPLKPALAESWEVSADGTEYTFYLRQGVRFHDGSGFDAEDVAFNVRRAWDPDFAYFDASAAGQLFHTYRFLERVDVIDAHTIRFTMRQPFSSFPRMLAQGGMGSAGIFNPEIVIEQGQDAVARNPVGTGPFRFVDRVPGEKIELARNEDYWGRTAYLDRVIFRPIPDAATRVVALETGQVDVISVVPPDSVGNLEAAGLNVVMGTPPHVWYLQYNFANPVMQDIRVRQAIIMGIDRAGMAEFLLNNTASPANGIQSPGNEAYEPDFVDYAYDPEAARALLEAAGYGDGLDITYRHPIDGSGQLVPVSMAEWIQRDLAAIGINVRLDGQEWNTFLNVFGEGEIHEDIAMISTSWGFTTPYWLYIAAHSESGANLGKYRNAESDRLIEAAMLATSEAEALELWKQANAVISRDDPAYGAIINDRAPYAMAEHVRGFIVPSEQWYDLHQVWLDN